jgi:hypothetical protein
MYVKDKTGKKSPVTEENFFAFKTSKEKFTLNLHSSKYTMIYILLIISIVCLVSAGILYKKLPSTA